MGGLGKCRVDEWREREARRRGGDLCRFRIASWKLVLRYHVKVEPTHHPWGTFNAHWFQLFNAVAFQIMLGAPIILYAKSLGASSTVLGIIASFTPLMTVMQLPAARFLGRYSYREFVLRGWGVRTVFVVTRTFIELNRIDGIFRIRRIFRRRNT
jgi:hypothetical protein